MNVDQETLDAENARPPFQPPATFGEAVETPWRTIDTNLPGSVHAPDAQALQDLTAGYARVTGRDFYDDAKARGLTLDNSATIGETAAVAGALADTLPDAQANQLAPLLDVRARAAGIAQAAERQRAAVADRTYGLLPNAAAYMSELAHGMTDPVMLAGGLIGGPETGGLAASLMREFAVNAGIGGVAHEFTAPHREELGVENNSLLGDMLTAGAYGMGQGLVLRGAGWALGKAFGLGRAPEAPAPEFYQPAANPPHDLVAEASAFEPADFEAAARLADRNVAMDAQAPAQSFAGRLDAAQATDAAAAAIETGAPLAPPEPAPPASEQGPREVGPAPADIAPDGGAAAAPAAPPDPTAAPNPGLLPPASVQEPRLSERINAQTLLAFVKSNGGIQDQGGELRRLDLIKSYPGLVNRRGMTLDDARLGAALAGYLGTDTRAAAENTTVADFLDALREHRLYSVNDTGEVLRAADAAKYNRERDDREAAMRTIEWHVRQRGEAPLDREWLIRAADHFREDDGDNGRPEADRVDQALERSAIELYERDVDQAQRFREEPQLPEIGDYEQLAADQADRNPGDPGAADHYASLVEGDRPGTEGDARAAQGPVRDDREAPATEAGPEGTRQTLIDGVAPVTDRERLEAQAAKPLSGGNAAPPAGGLFDETARAQTDMFDLAPRRADVERAIEAAEASGAPALVVEGDDGRPMNAREALSLADDFRAAAKELADCIFRHGGET